jgi:hypothetical protein
MYYHHYGSFFFLLYTPYSLLYTTIVECVLTKNIVFVVIDVVIPNGLWEV